MADSQSETVNDVPQAEILGGPRAVNLDEFRRQLAGARAIVEALAIAAEMGAVEEMPQETLWGSLHAASDMVQDCIDQFDSDAFEAAWRGKAVRS
jgi:hypothetical protein